MNKKLILALANIIEAQPHALPEDDEGFSMDTYTHQCGTPSCIAGFACAVKYDEFGRELDSHMQGGYLHTARAILGIEENEARQLFEPRVLSSRYWPIITPKEAADVLRNLVATGEVDWSPVIERIALIGIEA